MNSSDQPPKTEVVPYEFRVDAADFRRLLLEHFPELETTVKEWEGLTHVDMGALEKLANDCIEHGDLEGLDRIYAFVGDLALDQAEVEPTIINAIHVSFLEGLNFENKKHGAKAKELLPAVLLEMWEAQMEHNRKIGWFD